MLPQLIGSISKPFRQYYPSTDTTILSGYLAPGDSFAIFTPMHRILIFGNSGSGKSTLANKLGKDFRIPILDLDTIVWEPNQIAIRRTQKDSAKDLQDFIENNISWIIEGCYSTLIKAAIQFSTEIYFLNPGISKCLENNRNRPWEPHKFKSTEEQAQTFEFLQNWIQQYEERSDEFGYSSHRSIFNQYNGRKHEILA